MTTPEGKFDQAIETARSNDDRPALLALAEAAGCADEAGVESDAWYAFAVGVAAHDPRLVHYFS